MNPFRQAASKFNRENPPPPAPSDDTVDIYHGYQVPDPFRPLENLDAPETVQWCNQEHGLFKNFIAGVEDVPALKKSLTDIWEYPRESIPSRYGDKFFSEYYDGKSPQPLYYIRDSLDGEPRVFLDPNTLSKDGKIAIAKFFPSPDGKLVAYLTSNAGSDIQTLRVRDIAKGEDLPDVVEDCRRVYFRHIQHVLWDTDSSKGFQYVYPPADDELKRFVVKHHTLGEKVENDNVVFELPNVKESSAGGIRLHDQDGASGAYDLMLTRICENHENAIYIKQRDTSEPYRLLFNDGKSVLRPIAEVGGKIYAITDRDAPKGRLVAIDPNQPEPEQWKTIIPEHDQDLLKEVYVHRGRIVAKYGHDTADKITIHALDGTFTHQVPLPEQSLVKIGEISKEDTALLFSVSGFQSPETQYQYELAANKLSLWKKSASKVDLNDTIMERIYATSKDGTQVPMTVIRRKDVKLDGSAALKLYGYGGFNLPLGPEFSLETYNWVNEGGIYVQANLRGGGEFGSKWYDDGRLANKQHVFDDFAACAEHLQKEKYTSPERTVISGRSNGGLLTLATVLQRPELFGAVLSGVPVTDMYRFHKNPYAASWKCDYGDPEGSKADFEVSRGYSPLHNVKKGVKYPPILVKTCDHDDNVAPSHASKFVANFQATADPDSLCLMRVEIDAGHGAGGIGVPTEKAIAAIVETHAFLEKTLGPINQNKFKEAMVDARKLRPAPDADLHR